MRTLVVVLIAVVAFASGTMLGFKLDDSEADASVPTATGGLPAAVEETRARLLEAAETGDYEALRELIPDSGFKYTFGDSVDGGPIAYWQELERTTDQRPIEALAAVLQLPYVLVARLLRLAVGLRGPELGRPLAARARPPRAAGSPERALSGGGGLLRVACGHRAGRHVGVLRRRRLSQRRT